MVTGQRSFPGKSQLSVVSAILEKEPVPICSLKPLTPPSLDHAIRRCLAKDPEERWQTARDLALELKWIAETGSQTTAAASLETKWQIRQRIVWAFAAICLLAMLAFATALWLRPAARVQPIRASLLPPPSSSFLPYNFAVSPDGRQLAFVALGPDGKTTLWVRALSGSGAQQLNGTEGASSPFWSPDSRQIGFFADHRLKTVDVSSSAVQVLCDKELGQLAQAGYKDPDLSPDGRFLVVSSDDEHNGKHFLRVFDLQRGTSTRLTDAGDEHYPLWSRDGKRIAYRSGGVTAETYEVPADGSAPPKILLKADMHAGPEDWSPDGLLLFMTVKERNAFPSLGIYSPSDQKVELFAAEGVEGKLSPDGKWVVYSGAGRVILVERFPGHGGRIQISAGAGTQPRWSHDGRLIPKLSDSLVPQRAKESIQTRESKRRAGVA